LLLSSQRVNVELGKKISSSKKKRKEAAMGNGNSAAAKKKPTPKAGSFLDEMSAPSDVEIPLLFVHPHGTRLLREHRRKWRPDALTRESLLLLTHDDESNSVPLSDELRALRARLARGGGADRRELHSIGAFVALVVGDALGAPLEFRAVSYDADAEPRVDGFADVVWRSGGGNKFGLAPGQWTDDASMALSMAESLLAHGQLQPLDLRLRFVLWWHLGYCNAFGYDETRLHRGSVGLGGNIGASFEEFFAEESEFTGAGDRNTSGNGSLMRLAPVPTLFAKAARGETPAQRRERHAAALYVAYWQSKTTHQGDEAAECCRLMTHVILSLIDAAADAADGVAGAPTPKQVLAALPGSFVTPLYSVRCLAASLQEERNAANASSRLEDRDWRWRADSYRFSPTRARMQPGYVGSYCMDALAMALHCAWATDSLAAAMLKCANLRGDSDTTTAITGQIVGAMYGFDAIPADWVSRVEQWDPHGLILLRASRLYNRERQVQERFSDPEPRDASAEINTLGSDDDDDDDDDDGGDDADDDDKSALDDSQKTIELTATASPVSRGITYDGVEFFGVEPSECEHVAECETTGADVEAQRDAILAHRCSEEHCSAATEEQWFCLSCHESRCGRHHNAHAMEHHEANPTHALAISFADLSVWCYEHEHYVIGAPLEPALAAFRAIKFGADE
jgi:ADP-ribosyl-[dinitrogen reductase] hydrolase